MSNDNELKVIRKIEIDTKPKEGYNANGLVKANYLHGALDKLVRELNKGFVSELDSELDSNKNSINQLSSIMGTESGRIANLIKQVGSSSEGLVHDLASLHKRVDGLEKGITDNDKVTWDTQQQLKGADTEFIAI